MIIDECFGRTGITEKVKEDGFPSVSVFGEQRATMTDCRLETDKVLETIDSLCHWKKRIYQAKDREKQLGSEAVNINICVKK